MSDQHGGQQPPQQPGQQPPQQQPPQQQPPQQQPPQQQPPQQGWQQPQQPGQAPQQWQQPQDGGGGLDPKVGGLLAYLLGWIGGLIMLLTQKHPEVRFHGAQSILLTIVFVVIYIGLWILGFVFAAAGIGFLASIVLLLANVVLWLAGLALWIFLAIKGYNLEHVKMPMIGDMAERWAAK